jgi:hypothetical protein
LRCHILEIQKSIRQGLQPERSLGRQNDPGPLSFRQGWTGAVYEGVQGALMAANMPFSLPPGDRAVRPLRIPSRGVLAANEPLVLVEGHIPVLIGVQEEEAVVSQLGSQNADQAAGARVIAAAAWAAG